MTNAGDGFPAFLSASADRSIAFVPLWDYPVIETLVPTGVGNQPILTDYAFQTTTPNAVFQEPYDTTIGPNADLWATIYTTAEPANNVVEFAY